MRFELATTCPLAKTSIPGACSMTRLLARQVASFEVGTSSDAG
jgi:hypothetical protein